jgi:lysyl-tRNA synthetase, class II
MTSDTSSQLPLEQLRQLKIDKLNELKARGIDAYPARSLKSYDNSEITSFYDQYAGELVYVTGRITSKRTHGKIMFLDITDHSGKIQIFIREDAILVAEYQNSELKYSDLSLVDEGDFIEVYGKVIKTKSEEVSIEANKIRILAKSLRTLPETLSDKETRFRRRYVDMNVNKEIRDRMLRRSKFWQAHRDFFNNKGFYEINIPVLEHVPGGADAEPFITHMNSIDTDFYLRISHELPLKRLIGGGFEKVYDIGPRFRNEGLSDEHLPEHIAMEFYWAYADWMQGMELVQDLLNYVIKYVYNDKTTFMIRGNEVDFSKGWEKIDFGEIFKEKYGIDPYNPDITQIKKALNDNNIPNNFDLNIPRGIDNLWKNLRKNIVGPAFLINHPIYLSPLQKPSKENPQMVERFQPIIAGSELGNGWSELNDPIEQFERFSEQQKLRDAGDKEAQWLDIDYVEMLEYGMPPTFGYGHSERTFWFLEDVSAREGVPFPQLKMDIDESTKTIYKLK